MPYAELGVFAVAFVSIFLTSPLNGRWASIAILVCLISAVAAVMTIPLSTRGTAGQMVALFVGVVGTAFGVYWWSRHRNEPEIFSPVFLGYLGAALALSATLTLVGRQWNPTLR